MTPKEAIQFLASNEVVLVDIRFTDLFGQWHHFTIPASRFNEEVFDEGLAFDG